jgi:hypothetical protein
MKKIWPFSFYFLFFAAIASFGPYMVLYYQSLEFTGTQIGLLTGLRQRSFMDWFCRQKPQAPAGNEYFHVGGDCRIVLVSLSQNLCTGF